MAAGINYLYNQLSKYGLSPTGNIQSDLAELKKVKLAKGESTTEVDNFTNMIKQVEQKKQKGLGGVQGQPPWASLMQSLGLDIQGSKEADFAAIQAKITQLESTNLSADQKASLATLKAQFEAMKKAEAQHHHKGQKIGKEGQKPQGPPPEAPWFPLLKTLGIQPQGSPQADFAAISTKLTQMQSTNLSTDQKANLAALQAQFEQYKSSVN